MQSRASCVLLFVPCILASWAPKVDVLDLTATDAALKGFEGGFVDSSGDYGYFVPHSNGHFARVSLNDFKSVQVLNLSLKDESLKGFKRGFSHGSYGYLVPHYSGDSPSGKAVRVDLNQFSVDSIKILDLDGYDQDLHGFEGGLSDGTFGYFVPHFNGKVVRFDLDSFSHVDVLDLTLADPDLRGFDGGFIEGSYLYLCPRWNGAAFGKVARFDVRYFQIEQVNVLDLNKTDSDLRGFSDCFSDGTFGYFVPRWNGAPFGKIARVDLYNFANYYVHVLDLSATERGLEGFGGGFCDDDFGYFVPRWNGRPFGKFVRVFLRDFAGSSPIIDTLDLTAIDAGLKGFSGAFTDGRFAYLVPVFNGADFGKVVRVALVPRASVLGIVILGGTAFALIATFLAWRLYTTRNVVVSRREDRLASEAGVELISTISAAKEAERKVEELSDQQL